MSKPIFYVYAARNKSDTKVFLILPATPYKILDALDQLRLDVNDNRTLLKFGIKDDITIHNGV
ncbi:MAG: hypothetical protein HDT19_07660 [Oscillibacter sp.]|nr:hypothetical protein [Oscillibacter sp.]